MKCCWCNAEGVGEVTMQFQTNRMIWRFACCTEHGAAVHARVFHYSTGRMPPPRVGRWARMAMRVANWMMRRSLKRSERMKEELRRVAT